MLLPPDDDALLGRDVVERVDETPVEVAVAVQRPATRQPAGRPAALVGFFTASDELARQDARRGAAEASGSGAQHACGRGHTKRRSTTHAARNDRP